MSHLTSSARAAFAAVIISAGASGVSAEVLLDTGLPGGFFGYYGYDVSTAQSVAVGFTPDQDYTLDDIGVWIMSNDFDAAGRTYTLSLITDASISGPTVPGTTVIETWNIATTAVGWQPVLETVYSSLNPVLSAGVTYWIVAESSEPAGLSPVWVVGDAGIETPFANIDFQSGPNWQGGTTTGAPGALVHGTLVPAPGTLALLAGAALLGNRRHRR